VKNIARIFNCMLCQQQKIICRRCDRGHIYCSKKCAQSSRQASRRTDSKRYQNSQTGRKNHAKRQRCYQRQFKKMTHHGSKLSPPSDLLSAEHGNPVDSTPATTDDIRCHYCGQRCSGFLRSGFLQQSVIRSDANIFLIKMKSRNQHFTISLC
jgi:hypothetical protein